MVLELCKRFDCGMLAIYAKHGVNGCHHLTSACIQGRCIPITQILPLKVPKPLYLPSLFSTPYVLVVRCSAGCPLHGSRIHQTNSVCPRNIMHVTARVFAIARRRHTLRPPIINCLAPHMGTRCALTSLTPIVQSTVFIMCGSTPGKCRVCARTTQHRRRRRSAQCNATCKV